MEHKTSKTALWVVGGAVVVVYLILSYGSGAPSNYNQILQESSRPVTVSETENCVIKGNVGFNTGERIYHVPGCPNYPATKIDERYGERWFCTEQEAVLAGWRKAYNCP